MPGQQILVPPVADYPPATDVAPPASAPTAPVVRLLTVPNWAQFSDDSNDATIAAAREPGSYAGGAGPAPGLSPACEPGDWPQRFARMMAEALAGSRPARQIMPWTSKRARSQFHRILPAFRSSSGQPRIVRVVASYPALNAIEMSVIAGFGPRTRAFAIRLERLPQEDHSHLAGTRRRPSPDAVRTASGGWVCTDIEAA